MEDTRTEAMEGSGSETARRMQGELPVRPLSASLLIVCPRCDALYRRPDLAPGTRARCQRCGATLDCGGCRSVQAVIALVLTGVVALGIVCVFPVFEVGLQGRFRPGTAWDGVQSFWLQGRYEVALLTFAVLFLVPALYLGLIGGAALCLASGRGGGVFSVLVRLFHGVRPWGMIDVFALGMIVSLIKLKETMSVVLEPAFWAFWVLAVVMALLSSLSPQRLWGMAAFAATGGGPVRRGPMTALVTLRGEPGGKPGRGHG